KREFLPFSQLLFFAGAFAVERFLATVFPAAFFKGGLPGFFLASVFLAAPDPALAVLVAAFFAAGFWVFEAAFLTAGRCVLVAAFFGAGFFSELAFDFAGALEPSFLASERPMAMACFG